VLAPTAPPAYLETDGHCRSHVECTAGGGDDDVEPGATLVFYTDGLVERRHRSIATGSTTPQRGDRLRRGPRRLV